MWPSPLGSKKNDCTPILIDLDRTKPTHSFGSSDVYSNSVMYNYRFDAFQHDWRQLGCIILLWATTSAIQHGYHQQSIMINHDIAKDKFLLALFNRGTYEPGHFDNFKKVFGGKETIKSVIEMRSNKPTSSSSLGKHTPSSVQCSSKRPCK